MRRASVLLTRAPETYPTPLYREHLAIWERLAPLAVHRRSFCTKDIEIRIAGTGSGSELFVTFLNRGVRKVPTGNQVMTRVLQQRVGCKLEETHPRPVLRNGAALLVSMRPEYPKAKAGS